MSWPKRVLLGIGSLSLMTEASPKPLPGEPQPEQAIARHSSGSWRVVLQQRLDELPGISSLAWTPAGLYVLADNLPILYRLDGQGRVDWRLSLDPVTKDPEALAVMAKPLKPDFEASTLSGDGRELLIYGSGSLSGRRDTGLRVELASGRLTRTSLAGLYQELAKAIGGEINIEGAALIANPAGESLVLANRGHTGQPVNQLVWLEAGAITAIQLLDLPAEPFAGVSGLEYDPVHDRLWLSATTEATASVYDDGAIGDSYLGWIDGFASRREQAGLALDGLLNLNRLDPAFSGQKIEGLALSPGRIWLGSDNDGAPPMLFALETGL